MTMELRVIRQSSTVDGKHRNEGKIDRSFGVVDKKGRELGARAYLYSDEFEIVTFTAYAFAQRERELVEGRRFAYRPSAMRGGASYGASQRGIYFATAAERDAAAEKYLAGAEKRARSNKAVVAEIAREPASPVDRESRFRAVRSLP